ncbi:MAG: lysophospholipid acyltransferase family protein [Cyanobacteria bacterium J06560_2]
MTRDREPFTSLVLYRLLKWFFVKPVLYSCLRGRLYGADNVPMKGPLIVVANHASHLDSPLLASCMHRPVSFMAAHSLFQLPVLGWAMTAYGAYPVKREIADHGAVRSAMMQLRDSWAVGIYLQGGRSPDGRVTSPKLGAALVAAKTQVPLLPVSVWGTHKVLAKGLVLPRPYPVTVRIGELIAPPSDDGKVALKAVTQRCVDEIHRLHDLGR